MEALGVGAILITILAILPYIAIIGTWSETTKMRKELEDTNEMLEELLDVVKIQKYSQPIIYSQPQQTQVKRTESPTMDEIIT